MKRTVFALLSVLVVAGCYEKTTMPEGLTADNFYIGTFTFTDFADGEKPESYTVEVSKDTYSVYVDGKLICQDNKLQEGTTGEPNDNNNEYSINWKSSKDFGFGAYIHIFPEEGLNFSNNGWKNLRRLETELTGLENGFDFLLLDETYDDTESRIPGKCFRIKFSTAKTKIDITSDEYTDRYPQTLEWNGKRYKSTVEAAFAK